MPLPADYVFYPDQTPPSTDFVNPFYDNATVFPTQYESRVFISQSGSVSAQPPRGAQVITGLVTEVSGVDWEPFVTGFVFNPPIECTNDEDCPGSAVCQNQNTTTFFPASPYYCGPWGAPSDVEVLMDGSILVTDSQNGVIYRITYTPTVTSDDTPWYREPGAIVLMVIESILFIICAFILFKVYTIVRVPSPEDQYANLGIGNINNPNPSSYQANRSSGYR